MAGAVRYRMLVATAAAPAAVIYEAASAAPDFSLPDLPDDGYVARVTAIAADGLEASRGTSPSRACV